MINYQNIEHELKDLMELVIKESNSLQHYKSELKDIFAEINNFDDEELEELNDLIIQCDLCIEAKTKHNFAMNIVHLYYGYVHFYKGDNWNVEV